MKFKIRVACFLVILLLMQFMNSNFANEPNLPQADLIIINSKVWTVDPALPEAEAVAILGERIVSVGSTAEVQGWKGPKTRVLDARGKLVLPGFNDSHLHFVSGGQQLESINLKDAASPAEFVKRVEERAKKILKGEWILGGDWDEQQWSSAELPIRDWIDKVTPDNPVFLNRYDGHMALANSIALRLAKIDRNTETPAGGEIVRDKEGNPNGLLKDAAMGPVYDVVPPLTHEQRLRAVRGALKHAASLGVTSAQDMSLDYADIAAYSELEQRDELTLRIYAAPIETNWEDQAKLGIRRGFGSSYLRLGAIKGFVDGSLGSMTAYFFEPYTDAPQKRGLLSDEMQPPEKMLERLKNADAAGLQLCIHAIGDQAISMILDQFTEIVRSNGARDRRFRIEHAQHMARKDFQRFAKIPVIASMQPYHAIDDGRWAEKRIGPERIKTTYAFKTFLDQGVRLAFGSDWSVAPLNPMLTIYAAVTRATLDGKNSNGWVPEEKISVKETIDAYTMGSAYAEFQETEKGSITPGKLADIVILNEDILSIDPIQIKDVLVETTIVGGKVVFQR